MDLEIERENYSKIEHAAMLLRQYIQGKECCKAEIL